MRPEDEPIIRAIHARQGIDYPLPRLIDSEKDGPKEVDFVYAVEMDGRVIGSSVNRIVSETMLIIEPDLDPRDKWTAIRLGQQAVLAEAKRRGIRELISMVPPSIMLRFCKRLLALKWESQRDGWRLWSRSVPHA
jgi:hypothetical protein